MEGVKSYKTYGVSGNGKPVLAPDMECFTDILDKNSDMVYYYDMNNEHVVEEIANAIIHIIEQRDNTNAFI